MSEITVTLSGTKTLDNNNSNVDRLYILNNPIIVGNKDSYEVNSSALIGRGGESLIYKAKRLSDGKIVALKFYDQYVSTPINNSNRRKVLSILKNSDYKQSHLMPLFDYGNYTVISIDGDEYNKPFDIIPYIEDGHVVKSDYATLKNRIIPDITTAMCYLHNNKIIHRDIKPSNIYIYNDYVVLADFGIASQQMADDNVVFTNYKHASMGYSAPEVSNAYATPKSDFYSLGVTIAALFKGKHIYHTLIESGNEGELYLAIKKNGFPLGCESQQKDLQLLVDALTILDENNRADEEAIMLFYNSPQKFKSKWQYQSKNDNGFEFNFEGNVCRNIPQLINAFSNSNNWEAAIKYLYKGGTNNSPIVRFLSTYNQTLAVKVADIIENKPTAKNYNLGLAQFLHLLATTLDNPVCPIYWMGKTYNKLSDIAIDIKNSDKVVNDIIKLFESDFILWKLSNSNIDKKEVLISSLSSVDKLFSIDSHIGYYYFMYKFHPDNLSENSPDTVFEELTRKRNFYVEFSNFNYNKKYLAYLASIGYYDAVYKMITNISTDTMTNLELCYRFFENICEDKKQVCNHYINFGPRAYLFYWKNNIDKYVFLNDNSNKLKSQIVNYKILDNNIDTIFECSQSLRKYFVDFSLLFQSNIYLSNMGIRDGKTIFAKSEHMFFNKNFFGINVPVGFYKDITKKYDIK